jgi:hypothetical protein
MGGCRDEEMEKREVRCCDRVIMVDAPASYSVEKKKTIDSFYGWMAGWLFSRGSR